MPSVAQSIHIMYPMNFMQNYVSCYAVKWIYSQHMTTHIFIIKRCKDSKHSSTSKGAIPVIKTNRSASVSCVIVDVGYCLETDNCCHLLTVVATGCRLHAKKRNRFKQVTSAMIMSTYAHRYMNLHATASDAYQHAFACSAQQNYRNVKAHACSEAAYALHLLASRTCHAASLLLI